MAYPHGIELAVLTRHLLTACANFPGVLETLEIDDMLFADTNDLFTPEAINRMLELPQPFVQLVDAMLEGKKPARVLGGGLRVKASNLGAYGDALRLACNHLFNGCKQIVGRSFSEKFRKNFHTHPLVFSGGFTTPGDRDSRLFLDQIVQQMNLLCKLLPLLGVTQK